ncbi:MAG TPA: hypothetical protein PL056_10600 [bacterium]|nr:hypothetical protein [bacterium]
MAYTWSKFQVGNYSQSEVNGFRGLANTGIIKLSDFKAAFTEKSYENMKSLKMIENKKYWVSGKETTVVRLTRTGKKFVKAAMVDKLYKYNPRQLTHDIKLSEKYISLSDKERSTWVHEGKMAEQYEKMGIPKEKIESGEIQTVDGCYTNSAGEVVAVEIVTSNYSTEKVNGKMAAVRYFSGGGIIDKVR